MQILGIASWYPTKGEPLKGTFFKEQFEALSNNGVKVTVLAIDCRSIRKIRKWGLVEENINGIDTFTLSLPLGPINITLFKLVMSLVHKITIKIIIKRCGKPDIIHAHAAMGAGILAKMCSEYTSIPFVITEHSTGMYKVLEMEKSREIHKEVYDSASKVIAVSKSFCACISQIKNVNEDIIYIPNLIDFNHFYNKGSKNKEFTFISIGFLTYKKGMDIVVKGFSEFNKKYPNSKLKVIGYGQEMDNLKELAKTLGSSNNIGFLGGISRNELPEIISSCHCLVMGSRLETFGLIFIEALACEIPIIGTTCDGPISIINDDNGLIVPIDDISKLSKAMENIYLNYEKYNKKKIREDAKCLYSEDSVCNQLIEVYNDILAKEV
ncbi:glycosyltransferase [Clostridium gasigenes]|uniref:glycosyltransferase n=1 Tax=Clostridium gasigenes TaxID=94869 RepID=UPI0014384052|nr:glycosyltransferase [Clostridium gasigenes]NKF08509.1 glycosyltransferase family 4 protein [Clostridium gasigenes]QSW21322.1 glycosyltransferase [Clostridium gasigenes]